jgi:hypothetical protein
MVSTFLRDFYGKIFFRAKSVEQPPRTLIPWLFRFDELFKVEQIIPTKLPRKLIRKTVDLHFCRIAFLGGSIGIICSVFERILTVVPFDGTQGATVFESNQ